MNLLQLSYETAGLVSTGKPNVSPPAPTEAQNQKGLHPRGSVSIYMSFKGSWSQGSALPSPLSSDNASSPVQTCSLKWGSEQAGGHLRSNSTAGAELDMGPRACPSKGCSWPPGCCSWTWWGLGRAGRARPFLHFVSVSSSRSQALWGLGQACLVHCCSLGAEDSA